jgi:hypothetical protein
MDVLAQGKVKINRICGFRANRVVLKKRFRLAYEFDPSGARDFLRCLQLSGENARLSRIYDCADAAHRFAG